MTIAREVRSFLFVMMLLVVSAKVFLGWAAAIILLAACLPVIYLSAIPPARSPPPRWRS